MFIWHKRLRRQSHNVVTTLWMWMYRIKYICNYICRWYGGEIGRNAPLQLQCPRLNPMLRLKPMHKELMGACIHVFVADSLMALTFQLVLLIHVDSIINQMLINERVNVQVFSIGGLDVVYLNKILYWPKLDFILGLDNMHHIHYYIAKC